MNPKRLARSFAHWTIPPGVQDLLRSFRDKELKVDLKWLGNQLKTNWKPLAKRFAHWSIPPGVQGLLRSVLPSNNDIPMLRPADATVAGTSIEEQAILHRNLKFLDTHRGQRCFILATGPSIRSQDLRPLQNEWCIAVSEFYKHEHYNLIKPAYYTFVPSSPPYSDEVIRVKLKRLEELKQLSQEEIFFFGMNDRKLVEASNLVTDKQRVYYLNFSFRCLTTPTIDLTAIVPGPASAALNAVWIGMYMGFSEIYLVGCDYDSLWKWDGSGTYLRPNVYQHFYDGEPSTGFEPMDLDGELREKLALRQQFRWTNQIALQQNTRIFNANPKSYLDVLPKIPLESVLKTSGSKQSAGAV
jgi:hypothetical protein